MVGHDCCALIILQGDAFLPGASFILEGPTDHFQLGVMPSLRNTVHSKEQWHQSESAEGDVGVLLGDDSPSCQGTSDEEEHPSHNHLQTVVAVSLGLPSTLHVPRINC